MVGKRADREARIGKIADVQRKKDVPSRLPEHRLGVELLAKPAAGKKLDGFQPKRRVPGKLGGGRAAAIVKVFGPGSRGRNARKRLARFDQLAKNPDRVAQNVFGQAGLRPMCVVLVRIVVHRHALRAARGKTAAGFPIGGGFRA
jgi:hypothetical protein